MRGGRALPPALTIFSVFCLGSPRRGLRGRPPAGPPDLFPLPNVGAGEGISLQPLPDEAEADRNRQRSLPDGTADQDLVPEPKDEMEKRKQLKLDPLRGGWWNRGRRRR